MRLHFAVFVSITCLIPAITTTTQRTILITGSSDGIGRETARQLALDRNNFIILHGRNTSRCQNVSNWLRAEVAGARFGCVVGDFRNLSAVIEMARQVNATYANDLNVVVLNAGIFNIERALTPNGLEETFQVNHLAHFLLAYHLGEILKRNKPSRFVFTASIIHTWVGEDQWDDFHSNQTSWDIYQVYGRSKLYNVMTCDALAKQLKDHNVTCNSLHPGYFQTKLTRWKGDPVEGVRTPAFLATSPSVNGVTGLYYGPDTIEAIKNPLISHKNIQKVWNYSKEFLVSQNLM